MLHSSLSDNGQIRGINVGSAWHHAWVCGWDWEFHNVWLRIAVIKPRFEFYTQDQPTSMFENEKISAEQTHAYVCTRFTLQYLTSLVTQYLIRDTLVHRVFGLLVTLNKYRNAAEIKFIYLVGIWSTLFANTWIQVYRWYLSVIKWLQNLANISRVNEELVLNREHLQSLQHQTRY